MNDTSVPARSKQVTTGKRINVKCTSCGWKGRRPHMRDHYPCPKCRGKVIDKYSEGYYQNER